MFIERDKEKESNEISILRHMMKNYYEIHRTNIFGVSFDLTDFNMRKSVYLRMRLNRCTMLQQQFGKIQFESVLSINKVLVKQESIRMGFLKNLFKK